MAAKVKFKWEWLMYAYIATGTVLTLTKMMAGRLLVSDTRPWYNRIWGDVDPFNLMVSIFTWPRYLHMGFTQGWDAVIRDLLGGWR
jgi:hypothetical protein